MHGFAWITHRGGQMVFGVAINFIAARQGARRRSLKTRDSIVVPSAEAVRGVPVLGPVYPELIYGPFAAGLCRVPDGAIYLVGAV